MRKVFVYGTLKSGYGNNLLLQNSKLIEAEAYAVDWRLYSLWGNAFPVAVPTELRKSGELTHLIKGEVYEVDRMTSYRLDRLEGYPNFYSKKEIRYCNSELDLLGSADIYNIENVEDIGFEFSVMSEHCTRFSDYLIWSWAR